MKGFIEVTTVCDEDHVLRSLININHIVTVRERNVYVDSEYQKSRILHVVMSVAGKIKADSNSDLPLSLEREVYVLETSDSYDEFLSKIEEAQK